MELTRLEHRIASFPSRGKEIACVRFTGMKQSTQNQGKESGSLLPTAQNQENKE
jgi:hypothetical protein